MKFAAHLNRRRGRFLWKALAVWLLAIGCSALPAAVGQAQESLESLTRSAARVEKLQRPLSQITLSAADGTESPVTPNDRAAALLNDTAAHWVGTGPRTVFLPDRYTADFQHRPLYFQERCLERCGTHYGCLQNAVSAACFLGRTAVLPVRMLIQPPNDCVASDGDCLTGQ